MGWVSTPILDRRSFFAKLNHAPRQENTGVYALS
jgi:hypothetical protein